MKKFTLSVFIAALTVCSASAQSLTSQVLQPLPAFNPHKVAQVTSQLPSEQPKAMTPGSPSQPFFVFDS